MHRRLITPIALLALAACSGGEDAAPPTTPDIAPASSTTVERTTTTQKPRTRIQKAAAACGATDLSDNVGDKGMTITFDTKGNDDYSGDDFFSVVCVLQALDVTEFVTTQIDNTRALDGMRTAEWDGYQAVWTYHPDDGLNISIHDTRG